MRQALTNTHRYVRLPLTHAHPVPLRCRSCVPAFLHTTCRPHAVLRRAVLHCADLACTFSCPLHFGCLPPLQAEVWHSLEAGMIRECSRCGEVHLLVEESHLTFLLLCTRCRPEEGMSLPLLLRPGQVRARSVGPPPHRDRAVPCCTAITGIGWIGAATCHQCVRLHGSSLAAFILPPVSKRVLLPACPTAAGCR